MMNIGFFELMVVAVVAFLVLKPEDWPMIFYKIGKMIRAIKTFQKDLKSHYQPLLDDMDLEDLSLKAKKKAAKKEPLIQPDTTGYP
jgi:sec-independent protein translocase protein TatB